MSFGINFTHFSDNFSKKLYYDILEAEDNGKNELIVSTSSATIMRDLEVGQIIFYKSNEERQFADYWQISDISKDAISLIRLENHVVDTTKRSAPYEEVMEIKKELKDLGFVIGGWIISSRSLLGKLENVEIVEILDGGRTHGDLKNNPNRIPIMQDVARIKIVCECTDERRYDINKKFEKSESLTLEAFLKDYSPIKWGDYDLIVKKVDDLMLHGIDEEQLLIGGTDGQEENENALVGFGKTDHLKVITTKQKQKIGLTMGVVLFNKRHVNMKTEEVNRSLQDLRNRGKAMMAVLEVNMLEMNNKVREMSRLIETIEIFVGVSENIKQISEGADSETEVINLYQKKLFMDEEIGVWNEGGIDFRNIDQFDEWMVENIDVIIPTETGIVIMQPRRNEKEDRVTRVESLNVFQKAFEAEMNNKVYVIMRNGSNIYRIWSEKIPTHKRLFPLQSEFQDIVDEIAKSEAKLDKQVEYYDKVYGQKAVVDSKDNLFFYIRNFLLIQGLINRTQIFKFMPPEFNILDISTHGDCVNYIYNDDDSIAIGDGFPDFYDWINNINKNIKKGKKIVFFPTRYNLDRYDVRDRFKVDLSEYDRISVPTDGVFTVKSEINRFPVYKKHWITEKEFLETKSKWSTSFYRPTTKVEDGVKYVEVQKLNPPAEDITYREEEELYITFFQGDRSEKYYNQWLRFTIYREDKFLVAYEDIDDAKLDYYLTDRDARRHYLTVLPLLNRFKEEKAKDLVIHNYYVDMILAQIADVKVSIDNKKKIINRAIDHWKTGNKVYENTFSTIKKGSVDEIKSVKTILDETKRLLKKEYKVDIVLNTNLRTKIQKIDTETRGTLYITGMSKKEFVDKAFDLTYGRFTKKKLGAICNVLTDEAEIALIKPQLTENEILRIP